jgi:hypothetical protein
MRSHINGFRNKRKKQGKILRRDGERKKRKAKENSRKGIYTCVVRGKKEMGKTGNKRRKRM